MPRNDTVVDNNVMCLFGAQAGAPHKALFRWLNCCGSLCCSNPVLTEYGRQNSPFVASLLDKLMREGRFSKIKNSTLAAFAAVDAGYGYTCNPPDIKVARNVFRSFRKILVSNDAALRNDINGFALVGGVKPLAFAVLAQSEMISRPQCACPAGTH